MGAEALARGATPEPADTPPALPTYAAIVGERAVVAEAGPAPRPRWPFLVLIMLGVLLLALPVLTGMFTRAAGGQQLLTEFHPFVSTEVLAKFRGYLDTVDAARADVQATQGIAGGRYERLDSFVTQYPSIRRDMSDLLTAVDGQVRNYEQLRAVGPFDVLPFLLAVPGLILIAAGVWGLRRTRDGEKTAGARILALLAATVLIAVPFADGLFSRAPAGAQLIDAFTPIMTHERVAAVQRHFVVLVAAEGELDTQFLEDLRHRDPARAVPGIDAFVSQWQPMTADFASLIGVMADNVDNFDRVVALDRITAPLGLRSFNYFGWFFLVPGVLAAAVALDSKGLLRWPNKK
ncbi:hypothetical protein [Mycobacteroides abscessus]|uniref:hypothetical protein n=1 Tax=Mycobacteroides abscessus TaxID=36809 RepID=UPI00026835E1|nr:hypothetical protein [Mycobacteroides abscessus]AMU29861.1 hypothetical protein A3N97_04080 [Mycobacteroides abscessus]EIU00199.1 hypothetical protein MA4S0726RA_0719 [Mycobacteroides abscessus 4S-0726-RA]EIU00353.1 hypothetical protein MA4S0303_1187 [Mycobacteroides abscessus 4S-0303]MBN7561461.1 hypothetical protein [Mycobacteroides abscessus subsp. abscessus]MDM2495071.1 hypothetical protein [Mycobacteroides abscessus]